MNRCTGVDQRLRPLTSGRHSDRPVPLYTITHDRCSPSLVDWTPIPLRPQGSPTCPVFLLPLDEPLGQESKVNNVLPVLLVVKTSLDVETKAILYGPSPCRFTKSLSFGVRCLGTKEPVPHHLSRLRSVVRVCPTWLHWRGGDSRPFPTTRVRESDPRRNETSVEEIAWVK